MTLSEYLEYFVFDGGRVEPTGLTFAAPWLTPAEAADAEARASVAGSALPAADAVLLSALLDELHVEFTAERRARAAAFFEREGADSLADVVQYDCAGLFSESLALPRITARKLAERLAARLAARTAPNTPTAQPTRATSLRAKADPLPPRESQAVARHKRRFEASRRFRHAAQGRAAALKAAERDEPSSARGVIPATPRGARPADRVRSASPVARGHVNAIELRGRSPLAAHTRRADEYTPAELHALLALPRVVYAHGETGLPQNYGLWRGAASEYVRSPS